MSHAHGWPFPAKVAFGGFLAIALFFLWTEHRAHLFAYWPFLLVLACPFMHLFMHHFIGFFKDDTRSVYFSDIVFVCCKVISQ